ncbi:MAG: DUF5615 family PIN-like protein [Gaiella sp.]|nr:DUF5615 family PIN-like protein [Gaiella sp.]
MRLLLDAHVSLRIVGAALEAHGHDVRGIGREPGLDGLQDEEVLALAVADDRILVTGDVRDFVPLLRRWGREGRPHAGCILVSRTAERQQPALASAVVSLLAARPEVGAWSNVVIFVPHWTHGG